MTATRAAPAVRRQPPGPDGATVRVLRRGLLALAAAGVVGTAAELAIQRHWTSTLQLLPWVVLVPLGVAIGALGLRPNRTTVTAARVVASVIVVVAGFGVFEHVRANYDAGSLDRRYSARWATMSEPARWWTAASGGVGPSPPLAPGVMAQAALCLGLATLHHPARSRSRRRRQRPGRYRR